MEDKIKQLELLVSQAAGKIVHFEAENATLKNRLRHLEAQVERLRNGEGELKELRDWKKDTTAALKKLQTKIERELKQ